MSFKFPSGLLEATRLVRTGSLTEATAAIQRALAGATPGSTERPASTPADAPAPGRMSTSAFTQEAGTRTYKTYVPRGQVTRGMPLVVMLHGCKQNPDDFAAGTRMNQLAEESGFVVVYPAQCPHANVSACWNWFQDTHQQRDQGEPALIAGITREAIARYELDARRVHVAGLSAGGAMAAVMGATYPELYSAVGIHSGLGYASARDLPTALAAMRGMPGAPGRTRRRPSAGAPSVRTIVFHGDSDTTVHPSNGERAMTETLEKVERGRANGRSYTRTTHCNASGDAVLEHWLVHGAGHAWSGGSPKGSFTDPLGPDASREMLRFFRNS
jgi:poly(hydroxyalkanoate) depolymerase family esterase